MLALRYTSRAEADLDETAKYTRKTWSEHQVEQYLDALEKDLPAHSTVSFEWKDMQQAEDGYATDRT